MEEKMISLNDIKGSDTNPFIVNLEGKMYLQPRANTIVAKGQAIIDGRSGEVISEDVLIGRRKIVDKSQFAKLYASEIGTLFELSRAAINVFIYLTKVMDYDNKAIFNYRREFTKLGYATHKQCLSGIRELVSKNIVYPHIVPGIWWLNPTIVCKGERFMKYTEYITQERYQKELEKGMTLAPALKGVVQDEEGERALKQQGIDWYATLDDQTTQQLDKMNKAEENRLQEAYGKGEDLYPQF